MAYWPVAKGNLDVLGVSGILQAQIGP